MTIQRGLIKAVTLQTRMLQNVQNQYRTYQDLSRDNEDKVYEIENQIKTLTNPSKNQLNFNEETTKFFEACCIGYEKLQALLVYIQKLLNSLTNTQHHAIPVLSSEDNPHVLDIYVEPLNIQNRTQKKTEHYVLDYSNSTDSLIFSCTSSICSLPLTAPELQQLNLDLYTYLKDNNLTLKDIISYGLIL